MFLRRAFDVCLDASPLLLYVGSDSLDCASAVEKSDGGFVTDRLLAKGVSIVSDPI